MNKKLIDIAIAPETVEEGAEMIQLFKDNGFDVHSCKGGLIGNYYGYSSKDGFSVWNDINCPFRIISLQEAKALVNEQEYLKYWEVEKMIAEDGKQESDFEYFHDGKWHNTSIYHNTDFRRFIKYRLKPQQITMELSELVELLNETYKNGRSGELYDADYAIQIYLKSRK